MLGIILDATLAGCSGQTENGPPESSPTQPPDQTTVSEDSTPSRNSPQATQPDQTPQARATESPNLTKINHVQLNDQNDRAVDTLDNFTVQLEVNVSGTTSLPDFPLQNVEYLAYVDSEAGVNHQIMIASAGERLELYHQPGVPNLFKIFENGEVQYRKTNEQPMDISLLTRPIQQPIARAFLFRDMGLRTIDGKTRHRFLATESTTTEQANTVLGGRVTDAEVEIVINPDNNLIITYRADINVSSENGNAHGENGYTHIIHVLEYEEVNQTTVSEPDWVDDAKANTS